MRVTSDFYVSALTRRAFAEGGFAAVERRGATEAGAIFIICRQRNGQIILAGPAMQAHYDEMNPSDRAFMEIIRTTDDESVRARLEREIRFDPDLWVVELEIDEPALERLVSLIRT